MYANRSSSLVPLNEKRLWKKEIICKFLRNIIYKFLSLTKELMDIEIKVDFASYFIERNEVIDPSLS